MVLLQAKPEIFFGKDQNNKNSKTNLHTET